MAKVNQKDTIDYDSIVVREPSVFERMWQYRYFYLMFIPVALVLFIFFYWPMLGVRYAFSTYKLKQITLRLGPDYSTGLGNFKRLFGADPFIGALRNTLVLSIVNLILHFYLMNFNTNGVRRLYKLYFIFLISFLG